MLTPDEIAALRDAYGRIADPINRFLLQDIARRVSEAGQLTSTAADQVWQAQRLGLSQKEIREQLRRLTGSSHREIERLLTQSADVGYCFDLEHLPHARGVPFQENEAIQEIVRAEVKLAQDDFTNLTQTMGMVDPYGRALPLQEAYRSTTDFAFKQVITGAADYNTAIRQATANLAKYGVRVIDYESGVHTSMEAAVRRNLMGGMGLMQEQISQHNHDSLGANGWEISAHAASAPDHEPIQGRQYTDAQYTALNHSLARRIGTLNCGHAAFPVILGIITPVYSEEQLRKFRADNAAGVDYEGRHYSMYEATQKQRQIERAIRTQKRRIQLAEGSGDKERLTTSQIRLTRLNEEYRRFSKAAGLRTQRERAQVAGFERKQAARAHGQAESHYKTWSKSIGADDSVKTLAQYYNLKYNNSPEYTLFKRYAHGVERGWISPNASFRNYVEIYRRIESEIIGKTAANRVLITGQTEHFMQRVLGTMADPVKGRSRSGVEIEDILDALINSVAIGKRRITTGGKASIKFTGKRCQVSINPDDGILIQVNPRRG